MRVALLTSVDRGFASLCVPVLRRTAGCEIALIIHASGAPASRWERLRRMMRKTRRIGLRGAINGLSMRRWYTDDVAELLNIRPIATVAHAHALRLEVSPSVNAQRTIELLRETDVDLALSLGNAWISPAVFSVPRRGMLNVHHELLPEYQGAQSVIWRLHDGHSTTGFTIHRVDDRIDTGDILLREEMPILFRPTLRETVAVTYASLLTRSAERLAELLTDLDGATARATPQGAGRRFTTPSWQQFRTMVERHAELYRNPAARG